MSPMSAADRRAFDDFNAAVAAQQKQPGFEDRRKASMAVAKRDPQLHQQFIIATNRGTRQRSMLGVA
ncbi:MAG: hypothetical protein QM754_12045 [Tepidisphaeraceae bacterium]